ncbi:signal sequence receptor subunit 1 l(1)G0320 [Arctopsyche grandis]|uniref:signal sequence receptor subunit 1 l(1)G0320 n=1 Tax=Arctopsyche grandis TaxID=121162 RepID=UPI00406DA26A
MKPALSSGLLLCLLVLPALLLTISQGNSKLFAHAEEDELEDEVVDVEGEDTVGAGEDLSGEDDGLIKPSPDADVTILFTKPVTSSSDSQLELPAGKIVEFLVGFSNNGKEEFTLETLEASFRYPMDFTFYIQNFSAIAYNVEVKPTHQATLSYSFMPSEAFAGRPFGLSINLNYRDASGSSFSEAVYNQTISVTEVNEGLDGETFFLYVFLGAGLVLGLVAGQQALATLARKRSPRPSSRQIETGTTNSNVDYEWLPKELLSKIKKSPKVPKPVSPKQKKSKKAD